MFDSHVLHPLPAWPGDESHVQGNLMRHHVFPPFPFSLEGSARQPHRSLPAMELMSWWGREGLSRKRSEGRLCGVGS